MNNQLLPPSWCVETLLHCRNLFLHYSSLDCIASYYKSVCHFSIHMRFSQVCFLPSAACRDVSSLVIFSLSPGDTYIHVYYILLRFFGFYFPVELPVVPVNPCWNCKASVLPYDPCHLISERSALKWAFHLILKLALQQADKNRFFKKRFCP